MTSRALPLLVQSQVLFPGATMPVRVWQPKHRKLVKDAVNGDRMIGFVGMPAFALGDEPLPKIGYVGCVARIMSARKIPGKQIRITIQGVERFSIQSFVTSPEPYAIAEVATYEDFEESPQLLKTFADEVRKYYERFARASGTIADAIRDKGAVLPSDAVELSMALPSIMHLDEESCQRFLASRSPLMRLRELSALLSPAAATAETSAEVHVRSRTNGHGAHRS